MPLLPNRMPPFVQILAFFAVLTVEIAKRNASFAKLFDLFAKTFGKLDVPNAFIAKPNAQFAKPNAFIAKPNAQFAKPNASIAKSIAQFAKLNAWLPILIYLFPKTFGK